MQLIMIEGLPGTGKSTVTEWIGQCYNDLNKEVTLLFEGDIRIPCDFYEMAGMPIKDFYSLCDDNSDYAKTLKSSALITENYAFIKIENYPEYITKVLRRYDMGDESNHTITVKEYINCAIERLKYWIIHTAPNFNTVVVDSGFLQNPINEVLFRKATDDEVLFFIKGIFCAIKELNPLCIYLCRDSAKEAIDFAKKVKGKEWADRVSTLLDQNGVPDLFNRRFDWEKKLIDFIPNIICKVNDNDWSCAKDQIKVRLEL